MPLYTIVDSVTGVRLKVEGPNPPTQREAAELFGQAMNQTDWPARLKAVEKRREKYRQLAHEFSAPQLREWRKQQEAEVADNNDENDGYNRTGRLILGAGVSTAKNFLDALRITAIHGKEPLRNVSEAMDEMAEGLRYSSNPHEADTLADVVREHGNSGWGGSLPALGEVAVKQWIQNAPNLALNSIAARQLIARGMSVPRAAGLGTALLTAPQEAGAAFSEMVDSHAMDESKARRRALIVGGINAGLEQFGDAAIISRLLGKAKPSTGYGASARRILGLGGKEAATEAAQEAVTMGAVYAD